LYIDILEDRCVPSTVTSFSGSAGVPGSLPFEVANAAPGDTIQFAASLQGETITLGNTLDVNKALTIDGAGSGITVNGGGNQVFRIEAGSTVVINALTITGGAAGGYQRHTGPAAGWIARAEQDLPSKHAPPFRSGRPLSLRRGA
jgi:hypothetical protein